MAFVSLGLLNEKVEKALLLGLSHRVGHSGSMLCLSRIYCLYNA
jgi:hypothetical protein